MLVDGTHVWDTIVKRPNENVIEYLERLDELLENEELTGRYKKETRAVFRTRLREAFLCEEIEAVEAKMRDSSTGVEITTKNFTAEGGFTSDSEKVKIATIREPERGFVTRETRGACCDRLNKTLNEMKTNILAN